MSTPFKLKYKNKSFPFKNIGDSLKKKYGGKKQTTNKEGKLKHPDVVGVPDGPTPTQEERSNLQELVKFDPKKKGSPPLKKTTNIPEDTNVGGSGKKTSGKYKGMSNSREDYTSASNWNKRHSTWLNKSKAGKKKNSK